jgi:uncharacterized protein (TIGR02444 family)
MTTLPLDGTHWSFALRLYSQPGASDACLVLQDRVGVDINILLFALFAAVERGVALDARDLQNIDTAVAAWRSDVVVALRAIRRRMKNGPEPAPNEVTEAVRAQIKRAELGAEQVEQAVLARWLDRHHGQQQPKDVDVGNVVRSVVDFFAGRNGGVAGVAVKSQIHEAMNILMRSAVSMK